MTRPACMTDPEYAKWLEPKGVYHPPSPCLDCLPDFAAEMRDIGQCDGEPRGHLPEVEATPQEKRARSIEAAREAKRRVRALAIAEAVELSACGLNQRQVAAAMGVTRSAVYQYLRAHRKAA